MSEADDFVLQRAPTAGTSKSFSTAHQSTSVEPIAFRYVWSDKSFHNLPNLCRFCIIYYPFIEYVVAAFLGRRATLHCPYISLEQYFCTHPLLCSKESCKISRQRGADLYAYCVDAVQSTVPYKTSCSTTSLKHLRCGPLKGLLLLLRPRHPVYKASPRRAAFQYLKMLPFNASKQPQG